VALVGAKRLGRRLASLLEGDSDVERVYVCCVDYSNFKPSGKSILVEEDVVFEIKPDVVVEDVGAEGAREVIRKALRGDSNVVVLSASVFSDMKFLEEVDEEARAREKYVVVPFGALPAMDALEALSLDSLRAVDISIRRSPEQLASILREAGLEPEAVVAPVVVYEGSTLEELEKVKEDINTLMAAVLASGKDPMLKIVADNEVEESEYKIKIVSDIAQIEVKANYKTIEESKLSEIIVYSVYRAVKRLLKKGGVVVV